MVDIMIRHCGCTIKDFDIICDSAPYGNKDRYVFMDETQIRESEDRCYFCNEHPVYDADYENMMFDLQRMNQ